MSIIRNVITLIGQPGILNEKIINKAFLIIEKNKGTVITFTWLAKDEACDIIFSGADINVLKEKIGTFLEEHKVDFIIQPEESRCKKMLISDMDSTIINQECIDEIADKLNLKDKVSSITERAMNGEMDFNEALRERVALLAGLDESVLLDVYKNHITFMDGAKELVESMKKDGAICILVSGGFTFFTEKVKEELGFHEAMGNVLEIENGKLTGRVKDPILDKNAKLAILQKKAKELGIENEYILAIGDGANDLPMINAAGLGVAYHAKPIVKSEAGNKLDFTGLKSLIYAQGKIIK